jgi:GNAT superfamily N-acetyltransferase
LNFLSNNCTFSVLNEVVLKSSSFFDCGHPDLNDFFSNDCIAYSKELLGKSYCFRLDSDQSVIACAFTVSNDSIKVNSLPNSRKKKLVKSIPRPKQFRSYPAVLIGRLGVNQNYKGVGIGRELMDFIKSWFIDPNNKTGCRFIVVDAYNEPIPIKYYMQNEFEFLFSTEEQEKEYMGLLVDDQLKTRLMYFDLIVLAS